MELSYDLLERIASFGADTMPTMNRCIRDRLSYHKKESVRKTNGRFMLQYIRRNSYRADARLFLFGECGVAMVSIKGGKLSVRLNGRRVARVPVASTESPRFKLSEHMSLEDIDHLSEILATLIEIESEDMECEDMLMGIWAGYLAFGEL